MQKLTSRHNGLDQDSLLLTSNSRDSDMIALILQELSPTEHHDGSRHARTLGHGLSTFCSKQQTSQFTSSGELVVTQQSHCCCFNLLNCLCDQLQKLLRDSQDLFSIPSKDMWGSLRADDRLPLLMFMSIFFKKSVIVYL